MFSVEKAQRATEAVDWGGNSRGVGSVCAYSHKCIYMLTHSLTNTLRYSHFTFSPAIRIHALSYSDTHPHSGAQTHLDTLLCTQHIHRQALTLTFTP